MWTVAAEEDGKFCAAFVLASSVAKASFFASACLNRLSTASNWSLLKGESLLRSV